MKYALIIACEYQGTIRLPDAKDNFEKIYKLLVNEKNYGPSNITVCTDISSILVRIQARNSKVRPATAEYIKREIKDTMNKLKSGDILFLYYTGHGVRVQDEDSDESDQYDGKNTFPDFERKPENLTTKPRTAECLFSSDKVPILDDYLFKEIVQKVPKGCILNAFIDACHSGTILDLPILFHSGVQQITQVQSSVPVMANYGSAKRKNVGPDTGLTFQMSSCLDAEKSVAVKKFIFFGKHHGIFTRQFLQAMKNINENSTYADLIKNVYMKEFFLSKQNFVVCTSHEINLSSKFIM